MRTLLLLVCCVVSVGCASKPSTIGSADSQITVGQRYVLQIPTIQTARRGYIDALIDYGKPFERLSPYDDFDPYSRRPLREVPTGSIVLVSEIAIHPNGFVAVYGEVESEDREEVDLSPLIGGRSFEPAKVRKYLKPK